MSGRPRPKATPARHVTTTTTASASTTAAATTTATSQFDLRNPNTLAASTDQDEEYDAETAAILNFDEISGQSRGVKRNAVNLDGYDSDSSNEGFGGGKVDDDDDNDGVNNNKKKKKKEQDDDDDDDMFGGGDGDEDATAEKNGDKKPGKRKKGVRFLEIQEIEGQEEESGKSGDDDEEEEEEEGQQDDEEVDEEVGAGGKKKNAPKMDGFNMRAEMEEGRFDDQGNFVRRAVDPDAVHDTWLEGVSKKEMKRAKESHEKREKEAKLRRREEDELITGDLISDLVLCLERGETALEALARLNTGKKPTKPKKSWQKKKGRDMEIDTLHEKEPEDPKEKERKEQIEKITTAADRLLSRGFNEIYDEPREFLTRLYKKETNEDWVEPTKETESSEEEPKEVVDEWEYKWSDGQGDGQIHGPYGGTEMKAWKEAGYFQEGVVFRRKGESESDWTRLPDF